MKLLLHICCANCAIYPVEVLRVEGHDVMGLFFNPNIQPYRELLRRKEALVKLSEKMQLQVIFTEGYPIEDFFRRVAYREAVRCVLCYQWRLEKTAIIAKRGKFEGFTTTLLFSKHQKHDLIKELGEAQAKQKGIKFFYKDFRVGWEEGNRRSLEMGLYRQNYCGCVYSEAERFAPRKEKLQTQALPFKEDL